ncbi:LLM class flavin-dependent oxidoreductase [Luteipulveratus halotolerans]|uniref:LLM class flavin-dependent oxidoreductase n=1 Tax=Luteipulveratus halotolerans TaxID=1631356 RepID=UPI0009E4E674|nr:LLM class flavin-dependent oxidoreductase [Luteipulveratus halotolerans]
MTALDALTEDGLSLGIELPMDNDLARRDVSGQGLLPDLTRHQERAQLADRLGFRALWLRDVPMRRPRDFGDAGQIFDPVPYLGYLAASTQQILLGTAGIVLPLRHPVTLAKEAAGLSGYRCNRRTWLQVLGRGQGLLHEQVTGGSHAA